MDNIRVDTTDMRMTYKSHVAHTNDIRVMCKYSIVVFNIICGKNIALRGSELSLLLGRSIFCIFHWNIHKLARNFKKYHCNQKQV